MAKKVEILSGGLGNEPWYMSRRVQGIALIVVGMALQYTVNPELGNSIIVAGMGFAGMSWVKPK